MNFKASHIEGIFDWEEDAGRRRVERKKEEGRGEPWSISKGRLSRS